MTDQTEREALTDAIQGNGFLVLNDGETAILADAILAAGFHRTPAPHVVTTVDGLRDLDPEKVPAVMAPSGNVFMTRHAQVSETRLGRFLFPATPLVPMQDTSEPPADDGYVSRNVYDYDEPEPPADVREALYAVVIDAPATGRPLVTRKYHPDDHGDQVSAYMLVDRILAAGFHRTPTPHVVTTAEELRNLDLGYVLIASGRYIGDTGTFENCHVRRLPKFITGTDDPLFEVLIYGDAGPHNLVSVEGINLPATVLTPAPAPGAARCSHGCDTSVGPTAMCIVDGHTTASAPTDREAQVEKAAEKVKPLFITAGLVEHDAEEYAWDAVAAVLTALREA